MGLVIGICGAGRFARSFIPLFKAHPDVDEVVLADLFPERARELADRFGVRRVLDSLDALCASDVDAIALFTQRHLHGPQTLQALSAGKHVYAAVPIGQTLDEIGQIVDLVRESRLIYMSGETSYYYPATICCRQRHARGDFGHIFYGEAQYIHDMSHGFYEAFQHSGGTEWKRVAGIPPMHYATHSVSMVLSVTGARVTHVSCLGWEDRHDDGIFHAGANLWNNPFSNQTALMRTSDGGMMRINEFRRIGWSGGNSVHMSLYGTRGSFEEQANAQVWVGLDPAEMTDLTDLLRCGSSRGPEGRAPAPATGQFLGVSQVHPVERLPGELQRAAQRTLRIAPVSRRRLCQGGRLGEAAPQPRVGRAKYCAPGLIAHESARQGGTMLPVPGARRAAARLAAHACPGGLGVRAWQSPCCLAAGSRGRDFVVAREVTPHRCEG